MLYFLKNIDHKCTHVTHFHNTQHSIACMEWTQWDVHGIFYVDMGDFNGILCLLQELLFFQPVYLTW